MTNITELTAKLKAAEETVELQRFKLERQAEDLHQAKSLGSIHREKRFEVEQEFRGYKERADSNSMRLAKEVCRLEDEIEAAQSRIAELSHDLEKQLSKFQEMRDAEHEVSRRYVTIRHILGTDSLAYGENHFEATEAAAKRAIDSLNSRTLTVKLPKRRTREDYADAKFSNADLAAIYNATVTLCTRLIEAACDETGIKLQIEGE